MDAEGCGGEMTSERTSIWKFREKIARENTDTLKW